jgi:hypothetical protein
MNLAIRKQMAASIGKTDDPYGRLQYDYLRLRNPSTGKIPDDIRSKELVFARYLPKSEDLRKGQDQRIQMGTWNSRGPYYVGGRTRALTLDVNDENIILAGGVSGGMWRSTNGGGSWTNTTRPEELHSISCIAQDTRPGKTNIWYYGTGEFRGNSASGGGASFRGDGIFKSTDGGQSWQVLPSTHLGTPQWFDGDFDYVWNIVTDPSNASEDEVYAAVYGGIKRSVNGGSSWTNVLGTMYSGAYTDVAITSGGVVYATMSYDGSSKGIWRSPDGVNWTQITPTGWPGAYVRIVIGIAPSNENIVYFLAHTPNGGKNDHSVWKYTYLSGNGSGSGGQWENRSANMPAFGGIVGDFDSQGSYDLVCQVKPDDEDVVFIGGTNVYRSTDGFATSGNTTWIGGYNTLNNVSIYPNHYVDQHVILFYPSNPERMLTGNDGGVFRTENNMAPTVVWSELNNGYLTTQFYTVAMEQTMSGDNTVLGGMQDRGSYSVQSASPTATWNPITSGDGCYCAIADGGLSWYTSWQYAGIYRDAFTSGGSYIGWTRVDPVGGTGYLFVNPYVLDPNDTDRMYLTGGDRLWRNDNLPGIPLFSNSPTSVNWTEMSAVASMGDTVITAIDVSRQPANVVYYGTYNGHIYRIDDAHLGNPVPTNKWSGKGLPSAYVSCIAIDPRNADKAMLVFSNYEVKSLWWTNNGGDSWTHISGNLEEHADGSGSGPSCRWAAILYVNDIPLYFVGTSTGFYSTTILQGGSTVWVQEGASSIGNVVVDMIDVREIDGMVVVGTHGKGMFSASVYTKVESPGETVPHAFELAQNYPNPFNPTTTIEYALPYSEQVKLTIYDARGRKVRTLVDVKQEAGRYRVTVQAQGLPTGMYLYHLKAGVFEQTRKLTLMK